MGSRPAWPAAALPGQGSWPATYLGVPTLPSHTALSWFLCCACVLFALQVAVGSDPRVSAPLLGPAVLAGLVSAGAQAVDVGLATTPAMFYGIVAPGAVGFWWWSAAAFTL